MGQGKLFETETVERYDHLTREELIGYLRIEKWANREYHKALQEAKGFKEELQERMMVVEDQRIWLRSQLFGKSSEKESRVETTEPALESASKPKTPRVQQLSERYPNAPRIERQVELEDVPDCSCCGHKLSDSGMAETSEFLTVIPKQYFIVEQKRHKYRCEKCHGEIKTAPCPPRIKQGSSYGDAMILDVALSK